MFSVDLGPRPPGRRPFAQWPAGLGEAAKARQYPGSQAVSAPRAIRVSVPAAHRPFGPGQQAESVPHGSQAVSPRVGQGLGPGPGSRAISG